MHLASVRFRQAHGVIGKACTVLGSAVDLPLFKDEV